MEALSRTVSHALRHEPWLYELELDDQGWVACAQLLDALRRSPKWRDVGVADLEEIIRTSDKRRFELEGDRIRALYGHSVPGRLRHERAEPPPFLFHGTSPHAAEAILKDGLRPMSRQYVHLSTDTSTARAVGARKHSQPVLLRIDAAGASRSGIAFYAGNEHVWLADHVPAALLAVVS